MLKQMKTEKKIKKVWLFTVNACSSCLKVASALVVFTVGKTFARGGCRAWCAAPNEMSPKYADPFVPLLLTLKNKAGVGMTLHY
jgi:hypothetical protein